MDSAHKLVVEKDKQMYMMKVAHDNLGHRDFYATKTMVAEHFWWPELERCELVLQDLSHLSDKAEVAGENTTSSDTYSFNISSTACGHNAYVTKVKWVLIYPSWMLWNDILDGR